MYRQRLLLPDLLQGPQSHVRDRSHAACQPLHPRAIAPSLAQRRALQSLLPSPPPRLRVPSPLSLSLSSLSVDALHSLKKRMEDVRAKLEVVSRLSLPPSSTTRPSKPSTTGNARQTWFPAPQTRSTRSIRSTSQNAPESRGRSSRRTCVSSRTESRLRGCRRS